MEDQGSSSFAGFGNGVLSEVFNQIGIPRENNSNLQTNLYIRGLPENFSDEKLRELCAPYGKVHSICCNKIIKFAQIVSTKAILDKATKKCRGYGFVDFDRADSAQAAIKGLSEQGTGIHAQMAKQQEQDPTNLYIANLPPDFDENRLTELLQTHGLVISSRILRFATN